VDDIFTKYVDILTPVVKESYEFETVEFDLNSRRRNGSLYYTIKGVMPTPTPKP
jgi:hypothetical protein